MKLDMSASIKALQALGDPEVVAWEAISIANLEMARAIRLVTVERGLDPADFTLVAFGGAGPQHAVEIAEELGVRSVVAPPHPGLFSALGLLLADWRFEARVAYPVDLEEAYLKLEGELLGRLGRVDYFVRYADVRYEGQGWELTVPAGRPARLDDVRRAFEEKHLATYGFTLEDRSVEVVLARVFAVIRRVKPSLPKPRALGEPRVKVVRKVYFKDGWVNTPVYWRDDLPVGYKIEGPAIVEEYDSTTVIPPGWVAVVGGHGELRIGVV
jgi:N-methylhydantoinase A